MCNCNTPSKSWFWSVDAGVVDVEKDPLSKNWFWGSKVESAQESYWNQKLLPEGDVSVKSVPDSIDSILKVNFDLLQDS